MDIGTIRGLGTLVIFVAFVALVLWAYGKKRKPGFEEAANLPFADDPSPSERDPPSSGSKDQ